MLYAVEILWGESLAMWNLSVLALLSPNKSEKINLAATDVGERDSCFNHEMLIEWQLPAQL